MKKTVCIMLALIATLFCFNACNFYTDLSGDLAGESEVLSNVENMMKSLAQNQVSDAQALMHPQAAENSESALVQISGFLEGRESVSFQQTDINVKTSNGTDGKIRQEQLTYTVELDDGENITLLVSHLSDNDGSGFVSFQIVLGTG
jgi:hypothetical protein